MATALVRSPVIDRCYTPFLLSIRRSRIHKRGVYAEEFIPARRKVIEYTGDRSSLRETARRGDNSLPYLLTLDNYWTIDGAVVGSGDEIIYQCCESNLRRCILEGHILYWSKRDIEPGE